MAPCQNGQCSLVSLSTALPSCTCGARVASSWLWPLKSARADPLEIFLQKEEGGSAFVYNPLAPTFDIGIHSCILLPAIEGTRNLPGLDGHGEFLRENAAQEVHMEKRITGVVRKGEASNTATPFAGALEAPLLQLSSPVSISRVPGKLPGAHARPALFSSKKLRLQGQLFL